MVEAGEDEALDELAARAVRARFYFFSGLVAMFGGDSDDKH